MKKRLVIVAVVVVVLAVVAGAVVGVDRFGAHYAEKEIRNQMVEHGIIDPTVHLADVPFLPVLWKRHVNRIDLSGSSWAGEHDTLGVTVENIRATVEDVTLDKDYRPVSIGHYQGRIAIPTSEVLDMVAPYAPGLDLTVKDGELIASMEVLSIPMSVSLDAKPAGRSDSGKLLWRIEPRDQKLTNMFESLRVYLDVPAETAGALYGNLRWGFDLETVPIPDGLQVTAVQFGQNHVELVIEGRDLDLASLTSDPS